MALLAPMLIVVSASITGCGPSDELTEARNQLTAAASGFANQCRGASASLASATTSLEAARDTQNEARRALQQEEENQAVAARDRELQRFERVVHEWAERAARAQVEMSAGIIDCSGNLGARSPLERRVKAEMMCPGFWQNYHGYADAPAGTQAGASLLFRSMALCCADIIWQDAVSRVRSMSGDPGITALRQARNAVEASERSIGLATETLAGARAALASLNATRTTIELLHAECVRLEVAESQAGGCAAAPGACSGPEVEPTGGRDGETGPETEAPSTGEGTEAQSATEGGTLAARPNVHAPNDGADEDVALGSGPQWWCLCVREDDPAGTEQPATSCRQDRGPCEDIARRARLGRGALRDLTRDCRSLGRAEHPADLLGHLDLWAPSSARGGWQVPGMCLLDE